jgi:hypothetical protein
MRAASLRASVAHRLILSTSWVALSALATACSSAPTDAESVRQTSEAISYSPLPPSNVAAFGAADLENAYNIPTYLQPNTTIALIVAEGDDPNAEEDLAVYRAAYGLPDCTSANGCFGKVTSTGATTGLPAASPTGAGEITATALDMASAGCPNCKLLVVELTQGAPSELLTAVDTAKRLGASAMVSLATYNPVFDAIPADDSALSQPGITVFAFHNAILSPGSSPSTDPSTYSVIPFSYPAESPNVISVGLTNLTLPATFDPYVTESATAWGIAGCGSAPKPAWQSDSLCSGRTTNDVAATGGPVWTFNTFHATSPWQLPNSGWIEEGQSLWDNNGDVAIGGVIASSLVAAIFAQTGNGGAGPSYPYAHTSYFNDVGTGSIVANNSCSGALCNTGPGYDAPTGRAAPRGKSGATASAAPRTT